MTRGQDLPSRGSLVIITPAPGPALDPGGSHMPTSQTELDVTPLSVPASKEGVTGAGAAASQDAAGAEGPAGPPASGYEELVEEELLVEEISIDGMCGVY
jgi:mycofactocin precursor